MPADGRNHTRNGTACITECASGFPNANGAIPPENGQILAGRGWNTYMVGTWHLCPEAEIQPGLDAAQLADRPRLRALLRFLGAETNQLYPELVYDSHRSIRRVRRRRATT